MRRLEAEMSQRFPEFAAQIADQHDLPYVQMSLLAAWLGSLPDSSVPLALERAKAFVNWCEEQPRGEDARDDLERDPAYWKSWVGEENYAKALEQFTATT